MKALGAWSIRSQVMIYLIYFATKTHNQRRAYVGVIEYAGQSPAQLVGIRTDRVAAAFSMREGNNSIHVRWKAGLVKTLCNPIDCVCCAVGCGNYGYIVSGSNAAILTQITVEGRHVDGWRWV